MATEIAFVVRMRAPKPWALSIVVALVSAACASGSSPVRDGAGPYGLATPLFSASEAWMGRPFYARRIAEQASPDEYEAAAKRLRFKLESRAVRFSYVGSDDPLDPRSEWAVPMGVVNGHLAVLTSRCEIDYKYPLREGQPDSRFRNLALFNAEGRLPRSVFMLAPISERPELSEARDPKEAHLIFDQRFYLEGAAGDRYFQLLATGRVPRVRAQLVRGDWHTNDGIDLVMLYFPLSDPAVAALRPADSLGIEDPMQVVTAAMSGRTDYLATFKFSMITPQCLHQAEAELEHTQAEARLWRGIAIVAAAAAVFPLLGPIAAEQGGLTGFAARVATAGGQGLGAKIPGAAWRVTQRVLSGEELGRALWDEGGHLAIDATIDGASRRIRIAGIRRGTGSNEVAARIVGSVQAFVRDRAAQLLTQSTAGHVDVASLIRADVGVDLATELLASGFAALDTEDEATLTRQPTLVQAAAFALQGARGPAVQDPGYQSIVQKLATLVAQ
jgi:hypothetical protein